jgi:predicted DNA-binding transcriptional regulator YafY
LPPLSFNSDEALVLILGAEFIARNFDEQFQSAAYSAYRKIDAVLQDPLREQVDSLKSRFHIRSTRPLDDDILERLRDLRGAIADRKRVRLIYAKQDLETNKTIKTAREVDPHSLTRLAEDWYLSGYCHLRQSVRMFRLTRIERLDVLKDTFEYPKEETDWADQADEGVPLFVQALFQKNLLPRVRETNQYTVLEEEKTPDGIKITFITQAQQDLVRWFLGYGGDVKVLEPDWLQAVLMNHAERMLKTYGKSLEND